MNKNRFYIFSIILLVAVFSAYLLGRAIVPEEYEVVEVIDGDTVVINDKSHSLVRYIGIDSPEILTVDSPGEPFSSDAMELNKKLLEGRKIRLEFDEERYDPYGRLLAYVYAGEIFVNEELVKRGLADSLEIKPNIKYRDRIRRALKHAQNSRVGIWSEHDNFNTPKENKSFLIKPSRSNYFIGQSVVVRGKITNYRKSDKVLVLKIENDLDIVIFKSDWDNFDFFGIKPEIYYVGSPVEAIGRIKLYKGRTQIIVDHPITLKKLL